MITCIIADDEPLAREGLAGYVNEIDFLQLVTTCTNPVELATALHQHPAELVFLDIQMPKMSGIDFLKTIQHPPMVIITTAFPHYAIEGFRLNVLDYLVKPITFDLFFKAATKARDYHKLLHPSLPSAAEEQNNTPGYFFIKSAGRYEKIQFADILYIEGMQNYVTIFTSKGKYITLLYLKHLEANLDPRYFIRVHKSYIVATDKIDAIDAGEIIIGTHRVPCSRNYREQVISRVVNRNLWDKIRFSG